MADIGSSALETLAAVSNCVRVRVAEMEAKSAGYAAK
jgi:hypothetical protein